MTKAKELIEVSERANVDQVDDKIDQVRDLLFGAAERRMDKETTNLKIKIHDLDDKLTSKIDRLEEIVDTLARNTEENRLRSLLDIGEGMVALGQRIITLSRMTIPKDQALLATESTLQEVS